VELKVKDFESALKSLEEIVAQLEEGICRWTGHWNSLRRE